MVESVQDRKEALIEKTLELVNERMGKQTPDGLKSFISDFFANMAAEDLLTLSSTDLYGIAVSMWKLAGQREPEESLVHVYNPNLEEHGWGCSHTVLEIVNKDMPFLVDSITNELVARDLGLHLVAHPIFTVARDGSGKAQTIANRDAEIENGQRESFIHFQFDQEIDQERLTELENRIKTILKDVFWAVRDWQPMLTKVDEAITSLENLDPKSTGLDTDDISEAKEFLAWMRANHFTLIGYREYDLVEQDGHVNLETVSNTGLGILTSDDMYVLRGLKGRTNLTDEVVNFLRSPDPLIILKANARSTVHRNVHLDYVGVKKFDKNGNVLGEHRFIGLFTSAAYNLNPRDIPLLRRKVGHTLDTCGFGSSSHDGKALLNILDNFPRDELFQISNEKLQQMALGILRLEERPRPRVFVRYDNFERFASVIVFVPREKFNTDLRIRIGKALGEAIHGVVETAYPRYGDDPLSRTHYIIRTEPETISRLTSEELTDIVLEECRTWVEDMKDALIEKFGEANGRRLAARYQDAFPASYKEDFSPLLAITDVKHIETLFEDHELALNFYRSIEDEENTVRFKIYRRNNSIHLSDCMPMMENMGLKVLAEHPYHIETSILGDVWVHDFLLQDTSGTRIDLAVLKEKFETTFLHVWKGTLESDRFNQMVLKSGLDWRDVTILRAYAKYLKQARIPYSQDYLQETLAKHSQITRLLCQLFHTRFDPASARSIEERQSACHEIEEQITLGLESVMSLDEDRILRRFQNMIMSTLRTNFFQPEENEQPKPYTSFKLDCSAIIDLPKPRPFREIFVYSPRVEGVHLRFGKVARGGLRWSDRPEDFRTEVLGLVKAQQVKNAVIVPVGSKGGFVPKHLPTHTREAMMEEGIACYKIFLSGLLDITDNLDGTDVIPPENVIRFDEDDPYLVVAADKGTATFSDIANGVAVDYGFWLGDAFASGGSAGYDHKGMGITARGAWEAVKRHFREMGTDIQTEPFTVVGVGDMSGDVFGNGMLLSEQIKLRAAFNHLHIFVDPNPDPATSFAERKRMFQLPRSNWADYNAELISQGGGIFERSAKSITLSPEIKAITGLTEDKVAPNDLIQAFLTSETDLLWFGGIGTYIKSSDETNEQVGDKANDALRINGEDLKAKVVGEGANLGVTQRGRIEFAANGGRINTDAVDNSAGVDCSDHEVNIKILVNAVVQNGDMTGKQRDALLADMTDEVAELVLRDNYIQTLALSLAEARGGGDLQQQADFMRALERVGKLDRMIEFLPDDEEIDDRLKKETGLTRPELSVILAYAKNTLFDNLIGTDVPDDPYFATDLIKYFPRPLRKSYPETIGEHRLRREIIATSLTNSIVNRGGPTFVYLLTTETGLSAADVARAYAVARGTYDLIEVWSGLDQLDNKVNADIQTQLHLDAQSLLFRQTQWFLRNGQHPLPVDKTIEEYHEGLVILRDNLASLLSEYEATALQKRIDKYVEAGIPEDLAKFGAGLEPLTAGCDIVQVAIQSERPVTDVAAAYFEVGALLGLDWLRSMAKEIPVDGYWERVALQAIRQDLYIQQRDLANMALTLSGNIGGKAAVSRWMTKNQATVDRVAQLINQLRASGDVTVSMLTYANRQIGTLIKR